MSRFLRSAYRNLPRPSSSGNLNSLIHRCYSTQKSPFESNILRILHNQIDYLVDYAPPYQPVTKFNSFVVEDRPGEQWMTMRRNLGGNEDVKIEATMFDGYMTVPRLGEDRSGEDLKLHISVLIGVYKGDEDDVLEFACSAWPDRLEIQKVYFLRRGDSICRPYPRPDFRALKGELQQRLGEFLKERGVNDELSGFLHEYMTNKDKIERIQWFAKLKSFVER
ncbi:Mitochondrial glycoprotein family protein [Euphorbia peplus]|nr:Mitochondrial glycoprotein family protein [Euphorbia peplus]